MWKTVTNSSYIFGSDKRLPRVEFGMSCKQLEQRRQVLARLNVDLSLKQVRYAVTLQTKTKPKCWGLFVELPTQLVTVIHIQKLPSGKQCYFYYYHYFQFLFLYWALLHIKPGPTEINGCRSLIQLLCKQL